MNAILDHPWTAPILSILSIAISLAASCHVLFTKQNTRAAIGWIGLIWLSPFLGTALYVLLGINRISRRARTLRADYPRPSWADRDTTILPELHHTLLPEADHLVGLARLVDRLTQEPLVAGNAVEPLRNGDEAYPRMIQAIDEARSSVVLESYIFNDDPAGRRFLESLAAAHRRGVAVRVLVDDLGSRYDLPTIMGPLRHAGIPSATFMPTLKPGWFPYFNLRTHRKILVVDGRLGFTGGLNIDKDYDHRLKTRHPKVDLHFQVRGPVVAHLMHTFADDWGFATHEELDGDIWFPRLDPVGSVFARGVASGPDSTSDQIFMTILGALAIAQSSVRIVTPYFVPEDALMTALAVAAMRGVSVEILLPGVNNLAVVQWASLSLLPPLLESGCKIWTSPPPFDHAKLVVVDDVWTFLGSANWDARSFRLNFELNLECYDRALARLLGRIIQERLASAEPITLEWLRSRGWLPRLRDNVARLFSPYL